ncbi:class I SAM-dependent methyltransferase [Desulfuribacillus alkaliarsenatis]|uniref:Methyltransferase small domain-containing protein n=1 Tax=Desulfuribacillus alkaliarsenatis TaxID=766136 RepID=A0A1E5G4C2_9FIRM|nr:methyltransferase [Desulfuribacillus alkaliarsenatis]OEF97947.1 hypothetical protein BHF68_12825 [Desulfuribacillus alkaliarsenatis]
MSHYYSKNPTVSSRETTIKAKLKDREWEFLTDAGVFSKGGVDFGTRLLIETVEITDGDTLLDLGCGYGVVGIVLGAETPAGLITMSDINERAVELAKKNCKKYQITNATVIASDGFENIPHQEFKHIITNPPIRAGKAKIYQLFDETTKYLGHSGSLWVVMHKKHGAESAIKKLENLYKSVKIVNKKSGYHIIKADNS